VDEVIQVLKKWAIVCAVAAGAAMVGCGGSSGGGPVTKTGGGGTTRKPAATVTIPNEFAALIYVSFLTGQGRALGDVYLNVENAFVNDTYNKRNVQATDNSPLRLHLAAYTLQYKPIDDTTTDPVSGISYPNSETFSQFTLLPFSAAVEQAGGYVGLYPPSQSAAGDPGVYAPDPATFPQTVPIRLTTFPGRDSNLPVFIDDSMVSIDSNNLGTLNVAQFDAVNLVTSSDPTVNGKIPGYIMDYIQFDLSKVPAANTPSLMVSGKKATHFYLSGDNYAMSDDTSSVTTGHFEQLTLDPSNPLDGYMYTTPSSVTGANQFPGLDFPSTYDLRQANPSDLTGVSKITSLYGRWRPLTTLMNLQNTTFDIIIFPNSNESYTQSSPTDAVAIVHNNPANPSQITNMYAGYAYYDANSGKPMARLYPLPAFVQASTAGEVDYDLSAFTDINGNSTTSEASIRNGTYTLVSGSPPSGFGTSGTFVVFR
jgi:hypothetical protein